MKRILSFIFSLSVKVKLSFLIFMIVLSISGVSILINIDIHKNNTNLIINELIKTNINSNKQFVSEYIMTRNNWELYRFLKTLSTSMMIQSAGFIDNHDRIIAHTNTKEYRIGDVFKDFSDYTLVPFEQDSVVFGSFILKVKKQTFFSMVKESFFVQFVFFFTVALISFFIGSFFAGKLLSRLYLLSNNAQAMIEKKWENVKYYDGWENDEITALIKSTTKLMQNLQSSIEKEEKNARILHSLSILGDISASFAHEVKNLLQPLKLLIPKETPPDKEDMPIIHNTLMRIDNQVVDFLALARPMDSFKDVSSNAAEYFDESIELLRPRFEQKSLHVTRRIEDEFLVNLSPKAIELIIINLLGNAIDAAYENSTIEISWQQIDENFSKLCVQNSGVTMDAHTKDNLFKPFFTTKRDGSGLGLFSIYKIVYLSGGYIEFESQDEQTIFSIYLVIGDKK